MLLLEVQYNHKKVKRLDYSIEDESIETNLANINLPTTNTHLYQFHCYIVQDLQFLEFVEKSKHREKGIGGLRAIRSRLCHGIVYLAIIKLNL